MSPRLQRFIAILWLLVIASVADVRAEDLLIEGGSYFLGRKDLNSVGVLGISVRGGRISEVFRDPDHLEKARTRTPKRWLMSSNFFVMPSFIDPHSHFFSDADAPFWPGERALEFREAEKLLFQLGVTSIGDPEVYLADLPSVQDQYVRGGLKIRLTVYIPLNTPCGELQAGAIDVAPLSTPGFSIGGVKIFADGGSCGEPALSVDANGLRGHFGDLWLTSDILSKMISDATERHLQVVIHAVGDRAIEESLEAFSKLNPLTVSSLRHRIDHLAVMPPEIRKRFKTSGVTPVIFGYYPACKPRLMLSPAFQDWLWHYSDFETEGIVAAWHGDDPWVGPLGPLAELDGLLFRREMNQKTMDLCLAQNPVRRSALKDPAYVLQTLTYGGAVALRQEKQIGSIEPGKFADLVLLDENPVQAALNGRQATVVMTILAGEVVWCSPKYPAVCEGNAAVEASP